MYYELSRSDSAVPDQMLQNEAPDEVYTVCLQQDYQIPEYMSHAQFSYIFLLGARGPWKKKMTNDCVKLGKSG